MSYLRSIANARDAATWERVARAEAVLVRRWRELAADLLTALDTSDPDHQHFTARYRALEVQTDEVLS